MRTVAAGVVLLLAAVSGCSGSEPAPAEVRPLASASVEPTRDDVVTATPSEVAPSEAPPSGAVKATAESLALLPVPRAAQAADAAGASAFARHYLSALQRAVATSDVDYLTSLSDPGCGGCANLIAAIESAAEAGHFVRGAELIVAFAEAPAVRDGETIVDLRYERSPGEVVDADGVVKESIAPEGVIDTQLRLRRTKAGWSVLGFRQAAV